MRLLTTGILALGLAAGACNRAEPTASAATATSPAGSADTAAPAPTVGTAEARAGAAAVREITIPAGTRLAIVLDTPVGSDTSRVEQAVSAHLSRAVIVDGRTVVPSGSRISGVVTDATRSGKVKGRAHVAVRFDTLSVSGSEGERYAIHTSAVGRTAPATKKKDALEIGAPAAGGAIIGGIIGGKKGAAIGAGAGGGAGTAVVLSTRGKEVNLPRGAALTLRLVEPLTVKVKS